MKVYRLFSTDNETVMVETPLFRDMYSYRSFKDWCKSLKTCYFIKRRAINKCNKLNN